MQANKNKKTSAQRFAALGIVALTLISFQSIQTNSFAAPATTSPLKLGKTALTQKNYKAAVKHFESAVAQDPASCECRLGLGKSLCKIATTMPKNSALQKQHYKLGAAELRKAIRLGKGSSNAIEANNLLLTLPKNITSPKTGADTPMIALANGLRGLDRGDEPAKPKVLEFYASWCEPCKQLKPFMEKAKSSYGKQVEFVSYNVDDPQVEKIIEDYEVSPIPALIFLDPSNQVVSYAIGYSGDAGLQQGIKKILPKS